ncbi:unnamed protein product [Rotaria sp. Silwood1]|nr:unnamed protein product [Rotaria sp. Silwood1]CAF4770191.1 unnamed protein product [Rotaria sp. Silwood1]CAF4778750.1 unnamed protein product [Rotaria sp. Silwood1]CAF4842653.1 unnamed protein product [Rotaria sp. Silwood1]
MRLKYNQMMATAIEQLVIDPQSRFLEMKSLQPYSTTDEYLYAMKEDLADWLANMYPEWCPITADNFIESLENGVLLCQHANNVNAAARKILPSSSILTNCKYRSNVRPQSFNARDNVSQFIKWARYIACVREVLMFESDDLILRKNEKNFILCLLEIARFGAKFGVSVPAIIKLEEEIEREIQRDKQKEILSYEEFKYLQRENDENEKNTLNLMNYQIIVDNNDDDANNITNNDNDNNINKNDDENNNNINKNDDENNNNNHHHQTNENSNNIFSSITHINDSNSLEENLSHIPKFSNNSKRRQNSEESYDSTTSSEINTTIITSNQDSQLSRTIVERQQPIVPPVSSSHLHKTVVKIANTCCCSQRFPVIRIGEGKYRIGESGTIIFIRILRNHVMVRVGGGWDTLENYLNKHDPCRRSGTHRHSDHHHHSNIPILAIPNTNISPSVQKNTPFGKSITIKTDEFPLPKPAIHDTNLVDAQLVITRGADGRHHIGQITYKTEEDILNQPSVCPHHHNQSLSTPPPPTTTKIKSTRVTGRLTPSSIYNKQSSPSTDQDYSSLTEAIPSKPPSLSSSSSLDIKDEPIEQTIKTLHINPIENQSFRSSSPINKFQIESSIDIKNHSSNDNKKNVIQSTKPSYQNFNNFNKKKGNIIESVIDTIDDYTHVTSFETAHDFNISDIEDVMEINKKSNSNDDTTNMDNDSLESSEGILEEKPKSLPPPPSSNSHSPKKSTGYCSTYYLAQKQKFQQEQAANRKRSTNNLNKYCSRSTTLLNVIEGVKKEEQLTTKQRRKPLLAVKRSQSSECIDKIHDISKIDRDSGFDEQDFRRERLQSNGDDNSSISSIKSPRNLTINSTNFDYRENKAYELRMKKLDIKRNTSEKESSIKIGRNLNSSTKRTNTTNLPIPSSYKYRRNSQPIVNLKKQQEQQSSQNTTVIL